jgi:sugar phosphate isomerase/epimerase
MARTVTLVTGQWADIPLEKMVKMAKGWGFDGLELACWGEHVKVDQALESDGYLRKLRSLSPSPPILSARPSPTG